MPDVAMCDGKNCPLKETCYRYRAVPYNIGQTYLAESPYKEGKCDLHWKLKDGQRIRALADIGAKE